MLGREEIPNLDVVRDRLLVPSSVTSKGSEYPAKGIEPGMSQSSFSQNGAREFTFSNGNYSTKWRANNYTSDIEK